jgi:hypothetical protein
VLVLHYEWLVLYLSFSSGLGLKCTQSSTPTKGKQVPIPEEMSQTLLTKETWTKYMPLTLLSQRKLALTARNTLCVIKSLEQLKNLKNGLVSYLSLAYTCHQQPNPSRETVRLKVL